MAIVSPPPCPLRSAYLRLLHKKSAGLVLLTDIGHRQTPQENERRNNIPTLYMYKQRKGTDMSRSFASFIYI